MGDWYETDFLSHLHIEGGEPVVMILMRQKQHSRHKSHACCNPYDKYEAFGLPVHGKYNEYGSVTDIKNTADIIKYLNTTDLHRQLRMHGLKDQEKVEVSEENLEDFLESVGQEDVYSENGELITRMFINERLYNLLIDNYKSRASRRDNCTYEELFDRKCMRFLESIPEAIKNTHVYQPMRIQMPPGLTGPDDLSREEQYFHGLAQPDFSGTLEEFHSVWLSDFMKHDDIVRYLLEQMYKHEDVRETYLGYLKELVFFQYVLESMRSGYLVTSGTGGALREMLLQKILAEYILTRCNEYVADWREENIDDGTDDQILSDEVTGILWLRH